VGAPRGGGRAHRGAVAGPRHRGRAAKPRGEARWGRARQGAAGRGTGGGCEGEAREGAAPGRANAPGRHGRAGAWTRRGGESHVGWGRATRQGLGEADAPRWGRRGRVAPRRAERCHDRGREGGGRGKKEGGGLPLGARPASRWRRGKRAARGRRRRARGVEEGGR
jgi:hypothetical protein